MGKSKKKAKNVIKIPVLGKDIIITVLGELDDAYGDYHKDMHTIRFNAQKIDSLRETLLHELFHSILDITKQSEVLKALQKKSGIDLEEILCELAEEFAPILEAILEAEREILLEWG